MALSGLLTDGHWISKTERSVLFIVPFPFLKSCPRSSKENWSSYLCQGAKCFFCGLLSGEGRISIKISGLASLTVSSGPVLSEVPRPPTLFPATSMTWAAFSTSSRACSISTRDRAMSARTVPCSTRGFPKATRDFACGHRRQDGRHGRCPAEERVEHRRGRRGKLDTW